MAGITRIAIDSDWSKQNDWRINLSNEFAPIADEIYRKAFAGINLSIAEGREVIHCTKDEAQARYDWQEGIDVILRNNRGVKFATLQEKILTYWKSTVTFEEKKNSGADGAWYYCTAQYYFVGYARRWWNEEARKLQDNPLRELQDWILIDLSALRRADAMGKVAWDYNYNRHDGRRATFRYVNFSQVPSDCVVSKFSVKPATENVKDITPITLRMF